MKTIEDLRKIYKEEREKDRNPYGGCFNPSFAFIVLLIGLILYAIL